MSQFKLSGIKNKFYSLYRLICPEIPKGKLREFSKKYGLLNTTNQCDTLAVIIPCYKHSNYLQKCLESVANQTQLPNQIIIVNDASPDNTSEIISEFITSHLQLKVLSIFNDTNLGQCASINKAISQTDADLYMILNDDDYLLPYACSVQLEVFRENPFIHLSGASAFHFSNDDHIATSPPPSFPSYHTSYHTPKECWSYRYYNDINMTHSGTTFSRTVWEHVGGYFPDKQMRIVRFSDRDFQLRCNSCATVATLNVELSFWRNNSSVDTGINS